MKKRRAIVSATAVAVRIRCQGGSGAAAAAPPHTVAVALASPASLYPANTGFKGSNSSRGSPAVLQALGRDIYIGTRHQQPAAQEGCEFVTWHCGLAIGLQLVQSV